MAAKAIAFAEARQPSFAAYATAILANAQALAEGPDPKDSGGRPGRGWAPPRRGITR